MHLPLQLRKKAEITNHSNGKVKETESTGQVHIIINIYEVSTYILTRRE